MIVRPDATLIASLSDAPAAVAIDCAEDAPVLFSTTPAPVAQPGVVTLEAWSVVIYASAFSSGVTGSIHGQHKVPIK